MHSSLAVTKSGTGAWDLGHEDPGMPGSGTHGAWDLVMPGCGDARTQGRGTRGHRYVRI